MAFDKGGKYHMNPAKAKMSDKAPMRPPKQGSAKGEASEPPAEAMAEGDAPHTTLHDHGDGSFHTESSDGDMAEHPTIDHALEHMKAKHGGSAIAPMANPQEQPSAPMCSGY